MLSGRARGTAMASRQNGDGTLSSGGVQEDVPVDLRLQLLLGNVQQPLGLGLECSRILDPTLLCIIAKPDNGPIQELLRLGIVRRSGSQGYVRRQLDVHPADRLPSKVGIRRIIKW